MFCQVALQPRWHELNELQIPACSEFGGLSALWLKLMPLIETLVSFSGHGNQVLPGGWFVHLVKVLEVRGPFVYPTLND